MTTCNCLYGHSPTCTAGISAAADDTRPNTLDEMAAVVTALKAGKAVQLRGIGDADWIDRPGFHAPTLNFARFQYRVKREPLELFAVVRDDGMVVKVAKTARLAEAHISFRHRHSKSTYHVVPMREVTA